ncbi:MAG TPA: hypothetical protein VLJ57_10070 [Burkholderiaceae bacterium]|nr:hypothetical protein [Burkholderiaceae bacterium]
MAALPAAEAARVCILFSISPPAAPPLDVVASGAYPPPAPFLG